MLSKQEKAYCRALLALKQKDYETAMGCFESANGDFGTNSEFYLLYQTTRLLLVVKVELNPVSVEVNAIEKEMTING